MSHRLAFLAALLSALVVALPARAEVRSETLAYEQGGTTFKGEIYWDDARPGKRPGVLVVPEWWGCNDYAKRRAAELARMGYVAFACDMYGEGRTTTQREEASAWAGELYGDAGKIRARATAALQQLAGFRHTDSTRLAAIGFCFGGMVALELARSGADIDAAVSFHGSLGTAAPAEPGTIKAEILVLNGAEDPMVKPADRAAFMDEMRAARADWTFVEHGGAVHSFTNPAAGGAGIGGVAHDERAERQSWSMMASLFERVFAAKPGAGA